MSAKDPQHKRQATPATAPSRPAWLPLVICAGALITLLILERLI